MQGEGEGAKWTHDYPQSFSYQFFLERIKWQSQGSNPPCFYRRLHFHIQVWEGKKVTDDQTNLQRSA